MCWVCSGRSNIYIYTYIMFIVRVPDAQMINDMPYYVHIHETIESTIFYQDLTICSANQQMQQTTSTNQIWVAGKWELIWSGKSHNESRTQQKHYQKMTLPIRSLLTIIFNGRGLCCLSLTPFKVSLCVELYGSYQR